jgi:peptide chain release factor 1
VQRYPKNDSGGRRHTSVVSVTALTLPPEKNLKPLPEKDLTIEAISGNGPGGQHMQRCATVIRIRHKPTGLQATGNGRDQHTNKRNALRVLTAKVNEYYHEQEQAKYNQYRKAQVQTGRGGDKCRTYNFINSRCSDHRTGKKTRNIKEVMKGRFDLLS